MDEGRRPGWGSLQVSGSFLHKTLLTATNNDNVELSITIHRVYVQPRNVSNCTSYHGEIWRNDYSLLYAPVHRSLCFFLVR